MSKSVADLAEALRAAADGGSTPAVLADYYAETVVVRHVPALPNDGPVAGHLLAEMGRREVAASGRALSGSSERSTEVTVEGDAVRMRSRTKGALADGTAIEAETNTLFHVADGCIDELVSEMDEASGDAWRQALVAGGIEVPEGFMERAGDGT